MKSKGALIGQADCVRIARNRSGVDAKRGDYFRIATRPESLDLLSTMTNDIRVATLSGGAFSYAERVPRQFPQHLWTLGEPHVPDANYAAELFRVTSFVASSTFMNSLLWGASVIPIGM